MIRPIATLVFLAGFLSQGVLSAAPGDWKRVGNAGDWKGTIAGTSLGGKLYTIERSGALYVTDPATGKWKLLGKPDFANTTHLFAAGNLLYTIERDGSLYKVSPTDGSWANVGTAGDWKGTIVGTVLGGKLYTVEVSGALYETDPTTGKWKLLGKLAFANTSLMVASGNLLYTIEKNGNLYRVSPANGGWERVGLAGDWQGTISGTILGGNLYTVETSGHLFETDLTTGKWKQLGKADFARTTLMMATDKLLHTIEADGSLYEVNAR